MNANRRSGVQWATDTLRSKPGRDTHLTRREVEECCWVAVDWAVYRTLTGQAGLSPAE
jgi:hypothetical protein